jgi:hypothetical protein
MVFKAAAGSGVRQMPRFCRRQNRSVLVPAHSGSQKMPQQNPCDYDDQYQAA